MSRVRFLVCCLFAALLVTLLALPSRAGNYGCGSGYFSNGYNYNYGYRYYQPTYYAPSYQTATYYPPSASAGTTCYNTPAGTVCTSGSHGYNDAFSVYNTPVNTFYRVAPDLAEARLIQEATEVSLQKFRGELAKQAEEAKRAEADRADREFKATVLQALTRQGGTVPSGALAVGGGYDPDRQRLEQDNAQLRAALEKMAKDMEALMSRTATPPNPTGPVQPPAGPPAVGTPQAKGPAANLPPDQLAKLTIGESCMPCHQSAGRKNLTDLSKLYYEDFTDIINHIISDDPAFVMPPPDSGKPKPGVERLGAFHRLAMKAPHRPAAGSGPEVPKIPAGK